MKGATSRRGQERPALHGVILTQQPPSLCTGTLPLQECMQHTAHHWQPWDCVGYGRLLAAHPPCADSTQLLCILQSILGETCVSPITAIPHRHNHVRCGSQLPDEGVMLGKPLSLRSPRLDCPCIRGAPSGPQSPAGHFSSTNGRLEANQEKLGKIWCELRCAGCGS